MAQPPIESDQIETQPAFDGTNITNVDATSLGGSAASEFVKANISFVTVTTSRSLLLTDALKYLRCTTTLTLTVPANASVAFSIGTQIDIHALSAAIGSVTMAAAGGVTINTPETLKLRKQHSTATLIKVATDEWDLVGDLQFV